MTTELMILGWTLVLALAQILIAASFRTQETGLTYNMGARDKPAPPMRPVTARLERAQANLFETLPLFAAALLIAHAAGREGELTLWGSYVYLAARVVYVPLYAAGIPVVRSLAWGASLAGLLMIFAAILK
ncbi:MAG: MAPEG family protein [Pseudomonadota bacterium]